MNKKTIIMNDLKKKSRLLISDFIWFFNPVRIGVKIIIPLIYTLFVVIYGVVSADEDTTSLALVRLSLATGLMLFILISMLAKEKPYVNKNKLKFMCFDKKTVIFSRALWENLTFVLIYLISAALIMINKESANTGLYVRAVFLRLPYFVMFYTFAYFVATWLISLTKSTPMAMLVSILVGLTSLFVFSINLSIPQMSYTHSKSIILGNESAFIWIPILNFTVFLSIGEHPDAHYFALIPAAYVLITMAATSKIYTSKMKLYLSGQS